MEMSNFHMIQTLSLSLPKHALTLACIHTSSPLHMYNTPSPLHTSRPHPSHITPIPLHTSHPHPSHIIPIPLHTSHPHPLHITTSPLHTSYPHPFTHHTLTPSHITSSPLHTSHPHPFTHHTLIPSHSTHHLSSPLIQLHHHSTLTHSPTIPPLLSLHNLYTLLNEFPFSSPSSPGNWSHLTWSLATPSYTLIRSLQPHPHLVTGHTLLHPHQVTGHSSGDGDIAGLQSAATRQQQDAQRSLTHSSIPVEDIQLHRENINTISCELRAGNDTCTCT